jgi:hypothetical protein
MKTHKDIHPKLAKAMRRVRALFVKHPEKYEGRWPFVVWLDNRQTKCGCIIAFVNDPVRSKIFGSVKDKIYSCEDDPNYWKSKVALHAIFKESEENPSDAAWAIRRIDQFLTTNT